MSNPLDEAIVSVMLILNVKDEHDLPIGEYRAAARAVAGKFGSATISELVDRLGQDPKMTAKAAGAAKLRDDWQNRWDEAILEILFACGAPAVRPLLTFLGPDGPSISQPAKVGEIVLRLAAVGVAKPEILKHLRKFLPILGWNETRELVHGACSTTTWPVLSELGPLVIHDPGPEIIRLRKAYKQAGKEWQEEPGETDPITIATLLAEYLDEYGEPPEDDDFGKAEPVLEDDDDLSLPEEDPAHKEFAELFAQAIVDRKMTNAHRMLASTLKGKLTVEQLERKIARMSAHACWPTEFVAEFGSIPLDELRVPGEPRLPRSISDEVYRNWMIIKFMPPEESQYDSEWIFDLHLALVSERGKLKIGHLWATADS